MVDMIFVVSDRTQDPQLKRLFQLETFRNKLRATHQDTWCRFFKTKSYMRMLELELKVITRMKSLIQKISGVDCQVFYKVELIGSTKLIDVQFRRKQRILVSIRSGDVNHSEVFDAK